MKSDDYVELFNKECAEGKPEKEVLIEILRKMLEEVQILVAKRKAITNKAMAACFDQEDMVWRSFCRKMPEDKKINQDAFAASVKKGNLGLFNVIIFEGRFQEYTRRQKMLQQLASKIKTL
jgi:hypothetical protein